MKDQTIFKSGIQFLLVSALLVIVITGIHYAQVVLIPILISIFLSILGSPIVNFLHKKRVPTSIAVLIVISAIILFLGLILIIFYNFTNSLYASLPKFQALLRQQNIELVTFLESKNIHISSELIPSSLNTDVIKSIVSSFIGGIGSFISIVVLILLMVSFILMEAYTFEGKLRVAVGNPREAFPGFSKFMQEMPHFMIFQTIYGFITGVITTIWLTIFGVDFAVMIGLITFFLCYIPNVGSAIALVITVGVTFIQLGAAKSVVVALGYLIFTFLLGSVIQPRLMGKMLGLSTLVVFLSVIFWGNILGPVGMLLCVPLTMALKYALISNENTKWIGIMLERGEIVDVKTKE